MRRMKIGSVDLTLVVATLSVWAVLSLLALVGLPRCLAAGLAVPATIFLIAFKWGYLNKITSGEDAEK